MSPSARDLLLHILDETAYLLSASDPLNQAEFLADPTLKLAQLTEHTKAFHLWQLIELDWTFLRMPTWGQRWRNASSWASCPPSALMTW